MTYASSDSSVTNYTYDNALRPLTYQATSSVLSGFVRKAAYEYNADGSPKFVDDQKDGRFDQAYAYDHLGRLTGTTSGLVTNSKNEEVPAYSQMISYNAFGNMTSRSATVWGGEPLEFTASYANNRKTGGNEVFDFEGHIVDKTSNADNYTKWKFDASGSVTEYKTAYETHVNPYYDYTHTLTQITDGEGQLVKRHSHRLGIAALQSTIDESDVSYYVRSTVLGGQILTELNDAGEKVETKVYLGGAEIAVQRPGSPDKMLWKHVDAITGSRTTIQADGNKYWGGIDNGIFHAEIEGFGRGAIPDTDPYPGQVGDPDTWPMPTKFKLDGNVFNVGTGCYIGGIFHDSEGDCNRMLDNRTAEQCPNNECGPRQATDGRIRIFTSEFRAYADGSRGWLIPAQYSNNQVTIEGDTTKYPPELIQEARWMNAPQDNINPRFITHLDTWFERDLADRIKEIAYFARDSKECAEAFRSVGAVPIGEQIINTTIVTQNVLVNPAFDSSWAPDDGGTFANSYRKTLASYTGYFGTVGPSDITQENDYLGRRFIFLTSTGIKETKFKLSTTIIHSFLHSGGVPRYSGWFNYSANDLDISNEKHAEIIQKCTKKQ